MHLILLVLGVACEAVATSALKASQGLTRPGPLVLMAVMYPLAFGLISLAMARLGLTFVYAVWSGLGTTLVTLIGVYYFREALPPLKLAAICLIAAGVFLLNAAEPAKPAQPETEHAAE